MSSSIQQYPYLNDFTSNEHALIFHKHPHLFMHMHLLNQNFKFNSVNPTKNMSKYSPNNVVIDEVFLFCVRIRSVFHRNYS